MMFTIYLVEDEERLRKLLTMYLEKEGYTVHSFANAEDSLIFKGNPAHLWILDIALPGMDGIELLKCIKISNEDVPIVFTSARDSEMDRVMGFHAGGDDYVTKPFSVNELLLRVKQLLKRVYKEESIATNILYEDYCINIQHRAVYHNNIELKLTSREFDLLLLLCQKKQRAFSRTEILSAIWPDAYDVTDRVVDDTIRRIRKKLTHLKIETIYGYGYKLL